MTAALPLALRKRFRTASSRLVNRKRLLVFGLGALVVLLRLALLKAMPIPIPVIPDEFSYLLLGSTLASWRCANPVPANSAHFETLFVLLRPTYASVYPVMQGLFLAVGNLAAAQPWAGVCLSVAAMSAATLWMLRGWMPGRWALLGALISTLQVGIFSYWMNSYWGGAPAALGGAIALGALARLLRAGGSGNAIWFGIGLGVLANSRPYEGFVLAIPLVLLLVRRWATLRPDSRRSALASEAIPLVAVCVAIAALMGWYFWRITGSPVEMPYIPYIRQYAASPAFFWQGVLKPQGYADEILRSAHRSFLLDYQRGLSISGFLSDRITRIASIAGFYIGPLWILVAAMLPSLSKNARTRPLVICLACALVAVSLPVGFQLHYAAPFTCVFAGLTIEALRRIRLWQRHGIRVARYIMPVASMIVLWPAIDAHLDPRPEPRLAARPRIARQLIKAGGQHLVLVRYGPHHALGQEWVYNEANIDSAPVIWARDLGTGRDEAIIRYYHGRQIWLLEPDNNPPRLTSCSATCVSRENPQ